MNALPQPSLSGKPDRPVARLSRDSKEGRLLLAFLDGRTFNKFEAARHLNDWCLNTTVSNLQIHFGIVVFSEWEDVPAVRGTKTARVKRYWLAESSVERAMAALGLGGLYGEEE
jgi:hypothetical protein